MATTLDLLNKVLTGLRKPTLGSATTEIPNQYHALLRIAGGEFREPLLAPGETHATIGGGYEDGLSYTSIANARVSSGFDLSQVSVLSGVVVSPGADVVLPAGVAPSDAFSGWRSVQFTS